MKKEVIVRLHMTFEELVRIWPDSETEYWLARDLQTALGYSRWENFRKVIDKAITACENSGYDIKDHFLEVTKKVILGSGAERDIEDIALTRYACYLIAQNGDPGKDPIAFAVTPLVGDSDVLTQGKVSWILKGEEPEVKRDQLDQKALSV